MSWVSRTLQPPARQALAVAAASSSRDLSVIVSALVDLEFGETAPDERERAGIVSWRDLGGPPCPGLASLMMRATAFHNY